MAKRRKPARAVQATARWSEVRRWCDTCMPLYLAVFNGFLLWRGIK